MATYDPIINDGDRVALASHLDLWMAGVRFGRVESHSTCVINGRIQHVFYVLTEDNRVHAINSGDLLGAVRS